MSWVLAIGEPVPRAAVWQHATAGAIFAGVSMLTYAWWPRVRGFVLKREQYYDRVLRGHLLMDVKPRTVTVMGLAGMFLPALIGYRIGYLILPSVPVAVVLAAVVLVALAAFIPTLVLKYLRFRRLYRLEDQLVDGIRTLTSGVRAGLNLIQAMDLLARNAVRPISEEFTHLVREYEHGISLEQAMANAGRRIGSPNYRLVFSALLTHRERGGDLGKTLDRIAESIREIHRLEKRIETLTAPGRTAARWMAAMPVVILLIFYGIAPDAVALLFDWQADPKFLGAGIGFWLLLPIVVLNVLGFLWIRKIVNIDI